MKPSSEEIFKWARAVYGEDPGKPWHPSAFKHIEALCDLAYAAGAAAMKERCAKECDEYGDEFADANPADCACAIRALGDDE